MGIDLGRERVPSATTLLKFRRLLEKHKLGEALFAKVGQVLQANGMKRRLVQRCLKGVIFFAGGLLRVARRKARIKNTTPLRRGLG